MGCSDSGRLSPAEISALPVEPTTRLNLLYDYWQTCVKPGKQQTGIVFPVIGEGQAGTPVVAMMQTPQILAQLLGKPATPLDEQIKQFSDAHKIEVIQVDGKLSYRLHADGKVTELFRTERSEAGLKDADSKISALAVKEEKELEQRYSVTFAAPGEDVDAQREDSSSSPLPHMVKARNPELIELEGVRAALERSSPSNLANDHHTGVKFYFLSEKPIINLNALATFQDDRAGKPSVYVWPGMNNVSRATEHDLTAAERKLPFTDRSRPESLESAITHELGHHQFEKLGYDVSPADKQPGREFSPRGEQLVRKMGWARRLDEKDADYNWLLEGRSKDQNGSNATFLPYSNALFFAYMRKQKEGGLVDKTGKVVPGGQEQTLSEDQMRKEALVAPATWYFEKPEEEYAESVKLFRLGDDARKALQKQSPVLYGIIKENDQTEINESFGTQQNGSPKMIRDVDGKLVENNPANRAHIKSFEDHS